MSKTDGVLTDESEHVVQLVALRDDLRALAELSNHEEKTARRIRDFLSDCRPDEIIENIGGYGLAAVFNGKTPGKTVLIRSELDALPVDHSVSMAHGSQNTGVAHKCGHDGHMTIVAGLALLLQNKRPDKGRVVLLFQPAEETGEGAARVLSDSKFAAIKPDLVFALHNLPSWPLGSVVMSDSVFASASCGMIVQLEGRTSHAGEPSKGNSPALAMSHLVQAFSAAPQFLTELTESAMVTVIHARLGKRAFGTSPGDAVVMATLRSTSDQVQKRLTESCEKLAMKIGEAYQLKTRVSFTEEFPVTINDTGAAQIVKASADSVGLSTVPIDKPFPWSEDFGHFTSSFPGALFGLGAGEDHPALHNPDYDFPETLVQIGINLFMQILKLSGDE